MNLVNAERVVVNWAKLKRASYVMQLVQNAPKKAPNIVVKGDFLLFLAMARRQKIEPKTNDLLC